MRGCRHGPRRAIRVVSFGLRIRCPRRVLGAASLTERAFRLAATGVATHGCGTVPDFHRLPLLVSVAAPGNVARSAIGPSTSGIIGQVVWQVVDGSSGGDTASDSAS